MGVDGWVHRWLDEWSDGRVDEWDGMRGWMEGCMRLDGWMVGWMGGRKDG